MTKLIDMTGRTFHRLKVIERAECPVNYCSPAYRLKAWWMCRCDCGNEVVLSGSNIRGGHNKSCGCYRRETGAAAAMRNRQSREITPDKRQVIEQFIGAGIPCHVVAKKMHITDTRIYAIRREMSNAVG